MEKWWAVDTLRTEGIGCGGPGAEPQLLGARHSRDHACCVQEMHLQEVDVPQRTENMLLPCWVMASQLTMQHDVRVRQTSPGAPRCPRG